MCRILHFFSTAIITLGILLLGHRLVVFDLRRHLDLHAIRTLTHSDESGPYMTGALHYYTLKYNVERKIQYICVTFIISLLSHQKISVIIKENHKY